MTTAESSEVAEEIVTTTGEYFERIEAAVSTLVDAIEAYGSDPGAFETAVERIGELESACDALLADLRSLVATVMDPQFSELFLLSGEVIAFYETADTVVNHAESFVNELDAIGPDLDPVGGGFREMADLASDAAVHLSRAATVEIRNLSTVEATTEVTREAEQVRMLEGRCDECKHEVVRETFDARDRVDAMLIRDLARELDDVCNAIEDATDRLVYLGARRA